MIFFGLLQLLVVAAIVALVVRATRRSGVDEQRGVHALRRFLQYSFLLTALFVGAFGLTLLLRAALPETAMAARQTADVARGLALTLVGVPVWAILWRIVARRLAGDPSERAAPAWSVYLGAAATVTLIVAFVHLVELGRWVVGDADYPVDAIAYAVVWTGVWAGHAWLLRHPRLAPTSPVAELAVLAGSAVGLVALALGVGGVLSYGLDQLYRLTAGPELVDGPAGEALRRSLVLAGLALPVWWWHWLRQALHAPRTMAWHCYVMVVAVLGGLLTAVIATGIALHITLQWALGVANASRAAAHFDALPGALAATLVGLWIWWYHHAVLEDVPQRRRTEPERAYEYLAAGVGLVAAAAGVTFAIMAGLQAVTPGALATADPGGRDTLVTAITLLVVGTPLWWVFWRRLQTHARSDDPVELRSPSRRAYLFLVFGLTGLTAIISLVVLLQALFEDLLEGRLSLTVLHDLRAAIGLVITAGGVSAYHWGVYREGRQQRAITERARPRSVLLVSSDGHRLAAAVAAGTGARVRPLHRLDAAAGPVDADAVTAAVLASEHPQVLVTVEADGRVTVIPYEDG